MTATSLTIADLFLASSLVLVTGALSALHGLGIEKRLAIAAARMVVQLALIGVVLKLVFAQASPLWTALLAFVMVAIAAYEAGRRPSNRIKGHGALLLSGVTLLATGLITTAYVTAVVLTTDHWFTPQVFLPILGMILGNALTAVALVLESLTQAARNERAAIEARLALGATAQLAFQSIVRRTLTTALLPTLNGMAVAGVVSLPGMMTGQILAGADPAEAAKYQIMIMFAIAGATALAAVAAAYGGVRLLTDDRTRLRLDRLAA